MFPNRVGRMVLDGVVDAHMWTSEYSYPHNGSLLTILTDMPVYQWYRSMLTSAEDAYKRFLAACSLAGPGSCDLARSQGEDPTVIGKRLEGLFASLYDSPISSINQGRAGVLTSGRARSKPVSFFNHSTFNLSYPRISFLHFGPPKALARSIAGFCCRTQRQCLFHSFKYSRSLHVRSGVRGHHMCR
jgi:hypothetical protein